MVLACFCNLWGFFQQKAEMMHLKSNQCYKWLVYDKGAGRLQVASCSWQRVSWITAALLLLTSISADPPASPQACGSFIIWLYFLKLPFAMSTHCCSALLTLLPTFFFLNTEFSFLSMELHGFFNTQRSAFRFLWFKVVCFVPFPDENVNAWICGFKKSPDGI